jgi:hypothetical protein
LPFSCAAVEWRDRLAPIADWMSDGFTLVATRRN